MGVHVVMAARPDKTVRITPVYVWPCLNCGQVLEVSAKVHVDLTEGRQLGFHCGDCLEPPKSGIVLAA